MTIIAKVYGRNGVETSASDGAAFAATWSHGTAKRGAPVSVARIVAKLANDKASPLTAHEREQLAMSDIAIAPALRSDPQKLGNELLAQGVPQDIAQQRVTAEAAKADAFVSVEPIRSLTFYKPANY